MRSLDRSSASNGRTSTRTSRVELQNSPAAPFASRQGKQLPVSFSLLKLLPFSLVDLLCGRLQSSAVWYRLVVELPKQRYGAPIHPPVPPQTSSLPAKTVRVPVRVRMTHTQVSVSQLSTIRDDRPWSRPRESLWSPLAWNYISIVTIPRGRGHGIELQGVLRPSDDTGIHPTRADE